MAALLDSNGPLDTVSAGIILFFSTLWFLGFGLQLGVVNQSISFFLTFGGMFPAKLRFASDLAVRGGGAFALCGVLQNLPVFLGTEGGGRSSRQQINLAIWWGFLIINFQNAVVHGNLGGWQSAFNLNWLVTNAFFALVHLKWVGNDVGRKLKIV